MAAQEFTTEITFTDADYLAMAAAAQNGVGEQLGTMMGVPTARALTRLVQSVLESIATAKVGATVRYEAADWLVSGAMIGGAAGPVISLDSPDGSAPSVVLSGDDVDSITAVGGGDVLWLIDASASTEPPPPPDPIIDTDLPPD